MNSYNLTLLCSMQNNWKILLKSGVTDSLKRLERTLYFKIIYKSFLSLPLLQCNQPINTIFSFISTMCLIPAKIQSVHSIALTMEFCAIWVDHKNFTHFFVLLKLENFAIIELQNSEGCELQKMFWLGFVIDKLYFINCHECHYVFVIDKQYFINCHDIFHDHNIISGLFQ